MTGEPGEPGGGVYGVVFQGRRYDTGDRLDYLNAVVQIASERDDLGPAFRDWLRDYVTHLDAGTGPGYGLPPEPVPGGEPG